MVKTVNVVSSDEPMGVFDIFSNDSENTLGMDTGEMMVEDCQM